MTYTDGPAILFHHSHSWHFYTANTDTVEIKALWDVIDTKRYQLLQRCYPRGGLLLGTSHSLHTNNCQAFLFEQSRFRVCYWIDHGWCRISSWTEFVFFCSPWHEHRPRVLLLCHWSRSFLFQFKHIILESTNDNYATCNASQDWWKVLVFINTDLIG